MNDILKISSRANPLIKSLAEDAKQPSEKNFFIEGENFIKDTPDERIKLLITTKPNEHKDKIYRLLQNKTPVYETSPEVMEKLSSTKSSQTTIALVEKAEIERPPRLILLERLQDPGNAGTIIRTAHAFNYGVFFGEGSVNPYMQKVVRSSAGAILNCYIKIGNIYDYAKTLKNEGFELISSELKKEASFPEDVRTEKKFALIIGNESSGVSAPLSDIADKKVYIRLDNNVESLNAAVAASILMYELI